MVFLSSNKFQIIILIILLFSSCLTIESDMQLNRDGSGTINIVYFLDKTLKDISFYEGREIPPLNLSENYIRSLLGGREDIRYRDYKTSEDELNYIVDVTFDFDNVNALNSIFPEENAVSLDLGKNETLFSQGIYSESLSISDETQEIFKEIYGRNYFKFIVRVPKDIIGVDGGKKISDREAVFSESFLDIITASGSKSWSVRW